MIQVSADGDTINLYYGAADSSIALARGSIRALLNWLDANGHSEHSNDPVTNEPMAGLPQNPGYTHLQFIFTQGGWLTPDDLKRKEAKLQGMVQIVDLANGPCQVQWSTSLNLFSGG